MAYPKLFRNLHVWSGVLLPVAAQVDDCVSAISRERIFKTKELIAYRADFESQ
jgi:hypothetical protein